MSGVAGPPGLGQGLPDDPPAFAPCETFASERIYASPWVGLRRDTLVLPDGSHQEHHVVEIPDAAVVVPVLEDGRILLIGQYRYVHHRTHWELPAGRIAPGEMPHQGAARELLEETGYRAERLVPLPGFYPTNGISAHFAHAFVAHGCRRAGPQQLEASERIVVRAFQLREIESLLDAGRILDAFAALPLLYYLRARS
jgi:8-oxo-dGTP pyrophosphatase MutT (NUDIX family)